MACPRCSPTPRPPRFCVRASSDTAPFGARGFVRAVASASTASGRSAHLTAQVAIYEGATVACDDEIARPRELALGLGAHLPTRGRAPPDKLDAAILFAPVGTLVLRHWRP